MICTRKKKVLKTPVGNFIAVADENHLLSLEFANGKNSPNDTSEVVDQIEYELIQYFNGQLKHFTTPLIIEGTPFQKATWQALLTIPYGETISYATLATKIGKPTAYRAVGLANSQNKFPIIIPCHRVINKNGNIGGYAGGIKLKERLLVHEKAMFR